MPRNVLTTYITSFLLLLLGGCAPWKLDKSVTPNPTDVATIKREIDTVIEFQKAVYEVSVFAVDKCGAKATREPFALMTLGGLVNEYKPEKLSAYYKAAGLDEGWRVMWADGKSPLPVGTRITELNGRDLENNKTGMGEFPYVKYFNRTARARRDAVDGEPFIATLENGRKITIPTVPACDVQVWSMPIFEDSDYSEIPTHQFAPVVIPSNAVRAARTQDEMRYLAGLAVYYGASSEAATKRGFGTGTLFSGIALVVAAPILYPIVAPITKKIQGGIVGGVTELNAALFSTQVLIDMGGNPYAGLDLIKRIESLKMGATRVLISQEAQMALKQGIDAYSVTQGVKASGPNKEKELVTEPAGLTSR